jgi:hypothetical protein
VGLISRSYKIRTACRSFPNSEKARRGLGTDSKTVQDVPGGKVSILGGHSIGHSKQESVYVHVSYSAQHAMSSHELQSALMLTVEFSEVYYTGKLYQLCHLNNKYRYQKQYVMSLSYQQFLNYNETALSRKPFGTYIYTFVLRMAATMTSQNIDLYPGTL